MTRLEQLALISAPGDGVTRLAYSEEDLAARELLKGWMIEAGLEVTLDSATNLIGSSPGTDLLPKILATGSHYDTVVNGGPLDGAYGLVAAIEVAAALNGFQLRHDLRVIAFANEEGARGTPGMFGSLVISGQADLSDLARADTEGTILAKRLRSFGGSPETLDGAIWQNDTLGAFIELHVEQGPILSDSDIPIGIVEAITGQRQFEIEINGCANHAGTTPMTARRDALVAAARIVLEVNNLAIKSEQRSKKVRVATVGRLEIEPSVRNVVPGKAILSVDLRDSDFHKIDHAVTELEKGLVAISEQTRTDISIRLVQSIEATLCHTSIISAIKKASKRLCMDSMMLVSGASHDSQAIAKIGPVGMIFVPSINGLSHSPNESTLPEHLVGGAEVLLHTLVNLDKDLPPIATTKLNHET